MVYVATNAIDQYYVEVVKIHAVRNRYWPACNRHHEPEIIRNFADNVVKDDFERFF